VCANCRWNLGFLLRVHDTGVMNSSQMRRRSEDPSGGGDGDRRPVVVPVIVTIGGVDPSAAAGLGRDLLTAAELGAMVRWVGTAWTEQSRGGVRSVEARAAEAVEDAVRWAIRPPAPGAVKIGMVPGPAVAAAILRGLEDFTGAVVVDPVLAASSGGALWQGPLEPLVALLRRATLATPNTPEAMTLSGRSIATLADACRVAAELRATGIAAVLVKGGHLPPGEGGADRVTDVLVSAAGERRYARPRHPGPSPRGTGCALATAVAVELAAGRTLEEAIERATAWLAMRIAGAFEADGARRLS
jgi:hydroxymethylpyrimidine kinase/phosphomethylpyrimidine kinase